MFKKGEELIHHPSKGVVYNNGKIKYDGDFYNTPSGAGSAARGGKGRKRQTVGLNDAAMEVLKQMREGRKVRPADAVAIG